MTERGLGKIKIFNILGYVWKKTYIILLGNQNTEL